RDEEEHEHRAHAVVGEALEELDREAGDEPQRVAQDQSAMRGRHDRRRGRIRHYLCPEYWWALWRLVGAQSDSERTGATRQPRPADGENGGTPPRARQLASASSFSAASALSRRILCMTRAMTRPPS